MFEGTDGHSEVSGAETVPHKEGQNQSLRGLCEGRENRGLAPVGEAPDSVRGLTRVQYSSRVDGKEYGRCLKGGDAWGGQWR